MGCFSSVLASSSGDFHAEYILGEKLGSGAFGQVRSCTSVNTGESFAVKVLEILDGNTSSACGKPAEARAAPALAKHVDSRARERKRQARNEADLWDKATGHVNVVRLYQVFMDHSLCYLVMERCRKSLLNALEEMEPWPVEADLIRIFYDVILALLHIHERRVMHRDVKPDNILLGGEKGNVVKLCDFGLASAVPVGELLQEIVGTPPYMSPEMLRGMPYSSKTDMWSFGVTCYVVLYGRFPYESATRSAKEIKRVIACGFPKPSYKAVGKHPQPSEMAERAVRQFLERDATRRVTAVCVTGSPLGEELRIAADSASAVTNEESLGSHRNTSSFLEVVQAAGKMVSEFRPESARCEETDALLHELQTRAEVSGARVAPIKRFTLPNVVVPRLSRSSITGGRRRFTTDGALFRFRKGSRTPSTGPVMPLQIPGSPHCEQPVLLGGRYSMASSMASTTFTTIQGCDHLQLVLPSSVKEDTSPASGEQGGSPLLMPLPCPASAKSSERTSKLSPCTGAIRMKCASEQHRASSSF